VLEYMKDLQAGGQFARLQIANVASQYTFILALLIFGHKRRAGPIVCFLITLAFVLAGISGNRVPLIYILVLIIFYNLFNLERRFLDSIRIPYVLVSLFVFVLVLVFARHLPMTFQRSLSFIPFIKVALEAKNSGLSTLGWRFDVWEAAIRLIPRYFWVGRGFAFSSADVTSFSARTLSGSSSVDITLLTGNYHNGLIGLIVDLGIFGFLTGMGFVFFAIRAERKNLRRNWMNPTLKSFHRVAFAGFMAHFLVYIVIGGGMGHIMTLFFWVLIMEGLVRTDVHLEELKRAEEHPVEQKPIWPGRRLSTGLTTPPARFPARA
jgi:O-antigen ligase